MQEKSLPRLPFLREQTHAKSPQRKATDFLQMNEHIAALIPNAARLIALQQSCEKILPGHFAFSEVLQLEKNRLTVGVPNQATAAKLRQRLPELQAGLEKAGWTVENIRVKVRIKPKTTPGPILQKRVLSPVAVKELEKLKVRLAGTDEKSSLADAINATLDHHL